MKTYKNHFFGENNFMCRLYYKPYNNTKKYSNLFAQNSKQHWIRDIYPLVSIYGKLQPVVYDAHHEVL